MNDPLTNFLLVTLIALIGYIAKVFFNKLDGFEKKIESIMIGDVGHAKDIERLQEDYADHEQRITELEKK